MLKVKNLSRAYKVKSGSDVYALNNVSLEFPKTGMVFILGKSGSGKSTLLNVLGGLDKYTAGELFVKGKSTSDFKQADFDSYRNTMVGFIFQEYNVLQEFNVAQNIGLSLELQGHKATSERINEILAMVGLTGYASRKPNELSGGENQRIAIARALIKNPDIIMADEPTGALDSETGKQILTTLRELAQTRLVLVVSHDREFATTFGDRIIELKDGQVISDVSRTTSPAQFKDTNIVLKDGLFDVKESYTLTKKDIKLINDYMKRFHRGEISDASFYGGEDSYEFINTNPKEINTDNSGYSPIKSKLPFKASLKMGVSGLRVKRFRLVLSIILASLSFAMFGLFDTIAAYNATNTMVHSFHDSNLDLISIQKGTLSEYDYYNETFLSNSDLEEIKTRYQGFQFVPIRQYNTSKSEHHFYNQGYDLYDKIQVDKISSYYHPQILGYSYLEENEAETYGFKLVDGSWPITDNEALITKYIFSLFEEYGYSISHNDELLQINSYQDMIGLELLGKTIVGILDTNFNEQRYAPLKTPSNTNYLLGNELAYLLKTSAHTMMVLAPGSSGPLSNYFSNEIYYELRAVENSEDYHGMEASFKLVTVDVKNVEYFSGKSYENLESELICNSYVTDNLFQMVLNEFDPSLASIYSPILKSHLLTLSNEYLMGFEEFINRYPYVQYKELADNVDDFIYFIFNESIDKDIRWDAFYQVYFYSYLEAIRYQFFKEEYPVEGILSNINFKESRYIEEQFYYNQDQPEDGKLTLDEYIIEVVGEERLYWDFMDYLIVEKWEEYETAFQTIERRARFIQYEQLFSELTLHLTAYNRLDQSTDQMNITLGGVIYEDSWYIYGKENPLNKLEVSNQGDFEVIVSAFGTLKGVSNDTLKEIGKEYFESKPQTKIILSNEVLYLLDLFNQSIVSLKNVFLIVSIILAVFASLLLINFIGVSVSNKKQEIGILRALGARSKDVFGIFLKEALIIALISFIVATTLTIGTVIYINLFLRREYNILLTFLNFGIRQVLGLLLVSTFVATLSSFFPVNKIARLRPIDAIKDRK